MLGNSRARPAGRPDAGSICLGQRVRKTPCRCSHFQANSQRNPTWASPAARIVSIGHSVERGTLTVHSRPSGGGGGSGASSPCPEAAGHPRVTQVPISRGNPRSRRFRRGWFLPSCAKRAYGGETVLGGYLGGTSRLSTQRDVDAARNGGPRSHHSSDRLFPLPSAG